jgi:hypothetical protein
MCFLVEGVLRQSRIDFPFSNQLFRTEAARVSIQAIGPVPLFSEILPGQLRVKL